MRLGTACLSFLLLIAACSLEPEGADEIGLDVEVYDSKADTLVQRHMLFAPNGYFDASKGTASLPMTLKVSNVTETSFRVEGPMIQLGLGSGMSGRMSIVSDSGPWQVDGWNPLAGDSMFVMIQRDDQQTRGGWSYAFASNGQIRSALWREAEIDPRAVPSWAPSGTPSGTLAGRDYDNDVWRDLSFPVLPTPEYAVFAFPAYDPGSAEGETLTSTITVSR